LYEYILVSNYFILSLSNIYPKTSFITPDEVSRDILL